MAKNYKKFLKIFFLILGIVLALAIVIVLFIVFLLWKDTQNPYKNIVEDSLIPKFIQMSLDDWHIYNSETSLPMRWSTLIDINNDGVDEIFLWWWAWQEDKIYQYAWDEFIDISSQFQLWKLPTDNTLAASSVDLDNNGYSDLVVSRANDIYIYYNSWTWFIMQKVDSGLKENTSPLWLSFWDIDKDWDLDIFISGYIKKELMDGLTNFSAWYGWRSELLLNNGDKTFTNITDNAWLDYVHNTFQWVFIDINKDTYLDLVTAYDTGEPRIYKNNWNITFSLQNNPYTGKFAYPMWIGIWDYDNDWDSDIFFSNIGSSLPKFMVKWNLESTRDLELWWFLLKNNGDFQFEEVSDKLKISDYEFSWWWVFHDMNNDGKQDLIVAENYVDLEFHKYFKLPGRLLIQKSNGTFWSTEEKSWVVNKHYGITPLISDFNQDWNQDLVWVNIDWESFVYIQTSDIQNNYLWIRFSETAEYIWAHVELLKDDWSKLYETYITWEWLAADQSNVLHFGLSEYDTIDRLKIRLLNGKQIVISPQSINTILNISDYE
jgi:enediyne biosynthesis protein E4